jgi:hypothetical protein
MLGSRNLSDVFRLLLLIWATRLFLILICLGLDDVQIFILPDVFRDSLGCCIRWAG